MVDDAGAKSELWSGDWGLVVGVGGWQFDVTAGLRWRIMVKHKYDGPQSVN